MLETAPSPILTRALARVVAPPSWPPNALMVAQVDIAGAFDILKMGTALKRSARGSARR